MDSRFRGNDVISGEPRSLSRTRLRAPDGRDARATGSLSPPHGRDARATAGETPALQIHHPMDGRFDLDFGKQVGKQFAAGAAQKIRCTHPALLQILLWHEKPREGLRMSGQQLARVTPAISCRRRCCRSSIPQARERNPALP